MKNPLFVELGKYAYSKKTAEERADFHSKGGVKGGTTRAKRVKKFGWKYWKNK